MKNCKVIWGLVCALLLTLAGPWPVLAVGDDPWQALQARYQPPATAASKTPEASPAAADPWAQLQAIFLPFSEQDEQAALSDSVIGRKVASGLHHALYPYQELISEASRRFDIPEPVIAAVIMVESGGRSRAKAPTSSAKGLMQTIDATFSLARRQLAGQGIFIKNDPFDPRASIMAGCWYFDRMFRQAQRDRGHIGNRADLAAWRLPAEYYYAGPGHGCKKAEVVIVYAGGRRVRIDKPAYSRKVLHWAQILVRS